MGTLFDTTVMLYIFGSVVVFALSYIVINTMGEGLRAVTEKIDEKKRKDHLKGLSK